MSGKTTTLYTLSAQAPSAPPEGGHVAPPGTTLTFARAARELRLRRTEFDLAVDLGRIRTVPGEKDGNGGRRVAQEEIERLRADEGFPENVRERVRTLGTQEGAELMGVTTARFTRFARLGLVVPVTFHLNRYRAVVWLYLAEEVQRFATDASNAPLLTGRTPQGLRDQLEAGLDLRPRNWRGRHLRFLLRRTEDPWARAGAMASLLDPHLVAELVPDPYERAHLDRHRPDRPAALLPDSPAARITADVMTAEDPDEIDWLRACLEQEVAAARRHRPAPRPTPSLSPVQPPGAAPRTRRGLHPAAPAPDPARRRRLLRWLGRGRTRPCGPAPRGRHRAGEISSTAP
ncbi:DUF6397 family protein [Streptomyces griseoaurantiacus]|uniref:Uncharacterized protein n=1 Tax=Streptomyces griseoaurantiacus TaxID=68213 RepID=A0A7W2DS03_9ACTN|nr:DUF6397 family protein [Streptomyces griseoaurantiacus]MBA5221871.1 hypothetical protein [Streptomyces griseoaurantiacus]